MNKKRQYAKVIEVDLSAQTVRALEGGGEVFAFNCVTGSTDHQTEPGHYRILRKSEKHISKTYGVPMHYALFFTTDGKAFHQYHGMMPLSVVRAFKESVTDYVGSHGCVRLTEQDAKALLQWADLRTHVIISGKLT
jgi:lipoprotein-anchoring transpeptidase ErfK/SrfK